MLASSIHSLRLTQDIYRNPEQEIVFSGCSAWKPRPSEYIEAARSSYAVRGQAEDLTMDF